MTFFSKQSKDRLCRRIICFAFMLFTLAVLNPTNSHAEICVHQDNKLLCDGTAPPVDCGNGFAKRVVGPLCGTGDPQWNIACVSTCTPDYVPPPVPTCGSGQHIEENACVDNNVSCTLNDQEEVLREYDGWSGGEPSYSCEGMYRDLTENKHYIDCPPSVQTGPTQFYPARNPGPNAGQTITGSGHGCLTRIAYNGTGLSNQRGGGATNCIFFGYTCGPVATPNPPQCNNTVKNECITGIPGDTGTSDDDANYFKWTCNVTGQTPANCQLPKNAPPSCGSPAISATVSGANSNYCASLGYTELVSANTEDFADACAVAGPGEGECCQQWKPPGPNVYFHAKVYRYPGCTAPPSNCSAGSDTWAVGAASCTASYPAITHGATAQLDDTTAPDTGSETASCTNGVVTFGNKTCTHSCSQTAGTPETEACPAPRSGNRTRTTILNTGNVCNATTHGQWDESQCQCPAATVWNASAQTCDPVCSATPGTPESRNCPAPRNVGTQTRSVTLHTGNICNNTTYGDWSDTCSCPSGTNWNGSACVLNCTATPGTKDELCPNGTPGRRTANWIYNDNNICDSIGHIVGTWDESACVCPSGQTLVNGSCTCQETNGPGSGQCDNGLVGTMTWTIYTNRNNICGNTTSENHDRSQCTCPTGTTLVGNACVAAVPSACGGDDGKHFEQNTAPGGALCAAGNTAGPVTGKWSWTCQGNVGPPKPCSAIFDAAIDGVCGTDCNKDRTKSMGPPTQLCSAGDPVPASFPAGPPAGNQWNWECRGKYGGATVPGKANYLVPVNGVCGSDNGQKVYALTNTCNPGTYSQTQNSNASNGYQWKWTCLGINEGNPSPACQALQKLDAVCGDDMSVTSDPAYPDEDGVTCASISPTGHCRRTDAIGVPVEGRRCGVGSQTANSFKTDKCAANPTTANCSSSQAGPWQWGCDGINGGLDKSCRAEYQKPLLGQCGSIHQGTLTEANAPWIRNTDGSYSMNGNLCSNASVVDTATGVSYKATSDNYQDPGDSGYTDRWTWSCTGKWGGAESSCYAIRAGDSNAGCGSVAGTMVAAKPTTNLCVTSDSTNLPQVVQNGNIYSWTCAV